MKWKNVCISLSIFYGLTLFGKIKINVVQRRLWIHFPHILKFSCTCTTMTIPVSPSEFLQCSLLLHSVWTNMSLKLIMKPPSTTNKTCLIFIISKQSAKTLSGKWTHLRKKQIHILFRKERKKKKSQPDNRWPQPENVNIQSTLCTELPVSAWGRQKSFPNKAI